MKTKIVLLISIFSALNFISIPHSFAACTAKWSDWNNCPGEWYFATPAWQQAAQKNGLVIDPATWWYSKASVEAFQSKNNLSLDGKIWGQTGPLASAQTLGTIAPGPGGNNTPLSPTGQAGAITPAWASTPAADWPVNVIVTEMIPGAKCTCIAINNEILDSKDSVAMANSDGNNCKNPQTRKYSCEVAKWLGGFQSIFREITRWVVYITMLLGVMAIAGAGILWAWGSESEEYTKKAKWWVMNILIGLVILFTFRYILGFLAPWIFQ